MNNHGSPALPLFDEIRVLARQVVHYVRMAERDPNPAYNIRLAIKCAESLRASAEELYRGVSNRQIPADLPLQADCETATPCRIHWSPSRHHRHPTNGPAVPAGIPLYNASGTGELLLLVEDETELAELVAEMLGGQGFRVILTPTGQEALQIYKENGSAIELVIINYFLPDMSGGDLFAGYTATPDIFNEFFACNGENPWYILAFVFSFSIFSWGRELGVKVPW